MQSLFKNCYSLTCINLSNFKTNNLVSMFSMFENCGQLISLDLSHFITSIANDMFNLFNNCSSLKNLKFNFNTEKVQKMDYMFGSYINLNSLNITSFNTSNCQSFNNMFENDEGLILYIDSRICPNLKNEIPDFVNVNDINQF